MSAHGASARRPGFDPVGPTDETLEWEPAARQGTVGPLPSDRLLPLVYDELRRLAAQRLGREAPGQSLQATGLVHEAYLRLIGGDPGRRWDGRGHFFAAAAEAMRRILVDRARDRRRLKRGGGRRRVDLDLGSVAIDAPGEELSDLDEALEELGREDPLCARLVALRYFAGLTQGEVAEILGLARRTADRHWAYARAWLYDRLRRGDSAHDARP
ncbi:ECF-type sigma factor [Tundrisphaera sp. TA3]|uniref:ECF-type sigma factor n=1 Tax=Tundrisphaera sp. TA3 TaxID=3435775 RepID=UPI003EB9A2CF